MTAAQLSRAIGVNEGTVSSYKKGAYEPKQRRLEQIASVLRVSPAWLMGEDVPMSGVKDSNLNDRDREIISMFSALTESEKKSVLDYISFVLSKR